MTKKLQTLRLSPETIELIRSKSKQLKITQSALIYYSINSLDEGDITRINNAKELVYG